MAVMRQQDCAICQKPMPLWSLKYIDPQGRVICANCSLINQIPQQSKRTAAAQNAQTGPPPQTCNKCGGPSMTGKTCMMCLLRLYQNMRQVQQYGRGAQHQQVVDDFFMDEPKINNDVVKWKEHFEGIGMPWNFYHALLLAAQSIRAGRPDSCVIDKDGYLVLKYATHWVKLKISEITVEPPG